MTGVDTSAPTGAVRAPDPSTSDVALTYVKASLINIASSFHDVYEHLERARQTRASSELQAILDARQARMRECGAPLPRRSASSRASIEKQNEVTWHGVSLKVDATQRDLCLAISDRLDVDEIEALAQLRIFFASEHRTLTALEPALSTSKAESTDDILDAFYLFFLEEQLSVIRCISALLRIAEDESNELYDVATHALRPFADPAFAMQCLRWFDEATSQSLPTSIARDTHYSMLWARHGLERQLALLEVVFLLYYGRLSASAALVADTLAIVQRTHFGQRQANAGFFSEDDQVLCGCIRDVLLLFIAECLHLEAALEPCETGTMASSDPPLALWAADPSSLSRALDVLDTATSHVTYAPLLLGFALVLRRLDEVQTAAPTSMEPGLVDVVRVHDDGPPMWQRLVQGAFDPSMDLFGGLQTLVDSPLLGSSTRVLGASNLSALAYRAVAKGLVLCVTELVQPAYLPDLDVLVDVWCSTFRAPPGDSADGIAALCAQFWTQDRPYATRSSLLETARRRFPASCRPLVRLAHALTGSSHAMPSPATATAVVETLAQLSTWAMILPPYAAGLAPWETFQDGDAPSLAYRLRTSLRIPSTRLVLPAGTRGVLLSPTGESPAIVLWDCMTPQSAWIALHDMLASAVSSSPTPATTTRSRGRHTLPAMDEEWQDPSSVAPTSVSPDWADTPQLSADIAELFADVLSADEALGDALLGHIGEPCTLVTSALAMIEAGLRDGGHAASVDVRCVCAGYRLLEALVPLRPNEVWQRIRSTNVLLGLAGPVPLMDTIIPASTLVQYESQRGILHGTLSLLDLLYALWIQLQASQSADPSELVHIKASVLARALGWLAEAVWMEHQGWLYEHASTRAQIGLGCMRLWSALWDDPCVRQDDADLAPLCAVLTRVIGPAATPLTLGPLLHVLAAGAPAIDALYRTGHPFAARRTEELVEACLTTVSQLVVSTPTTSVLPTLFFGTAPDARGTLASAVLGYVTAAVPASLAMAAAHVVTDMVCTAGDRTMRLAGHVGSTDQVEATCQALVRLLENTYTDGPLRCAVWHMLAALVATQPALATLLLTGAHLARDVTTKSDHVVAPTALAVAMDELSHADTYWDTCPALLDALLQFLTEAWAHAGAYPAVFGAYQRDSGMWERIEALLCKTTPPPPCIAALADMETRDDGAEEDEEEMAVHYAFRLQAQARALRVLSLDVEAASAAVPSKAEARPDASVRRLLHLCTAEHGARLAAVLRDVFATSPTSMAYARDEHVRESLPHLPWMSLRWPPRRDDYDRRRTYGRSYVYAWSALAPRLLLDEPAAAALAMDVNLTWSVVDAQAARAQAWTACVRTASAHLLALAETQSSSTTKSLQQALAHIVIEVGPLALQEGRTSIMDMLSVLMCASHTAVTTEQLDAWAHLVVQWLEQPAYTLSALAGNAARTSLAELLLAVVTAVQRQDRVCNAMPAILDHCMDALAQLDTLLPYLDVPTSPEAQQAESDLEVLVAIIQTCLTPSAHVPTNAWLAPLRTTRLVPFAVDVLVRAPLSAPSEHVHAVRTHVRFLAPLLRLLEALAAQPLACETLAQGGLVRALYTNTLSVYLESGTLDAVLPTGDPNPLHASWLCILRTLIRLLENAAADVQVHLVDTDLQAFVHVCAPQLRRALCLSPFSARPDAVMLVDTTQWDELRLVVRLVHAMWHAKAMTTEHVTIPLHTLFWAQVPYLLQTLGYVATHPADMATWLGYEGDEDPLTKTVCARAQAAVDDTLATLLALLWAHSEAHVILTCEPQAWPSPPALLQPHVHVTPHAPASIGTLLEVASFWTEHVRTHPEHVEALEQCLGLCATQMLVWTYAPRRTSLQDEARARCEQAQAELEAGLGRDLEAAVQAAAAQCPSAWWPVLRALIARYMRTRST
ncbi:nuclear pore inner ring protein [Malassezia pachydermatis]